jgi:S1-C subfamily serine protease
VLRLVDGTLRVPTTKSQVFREDTVMLHGSLAIVIVGLATATAGGQETLPLPAVAAIKEATVMITTTVGADSGVRGSGSGFLIRVDGQTGYVATNHHVISPP